MLSILSINYIISFRVVVVYQFSFDSLGFLRPWRSPVECVRVSVRVRVSNLTEEVDDVVGVQA